MPPYASSLSEAFLVRSESWLNALAWLAAVLFVVGLVALVGRRRHGHVVAPGWVDVLPAGVGFLALLTHVGLRGVVFERWPVANLHEASVFLALFLAGAHLFAAVRFRYPAVELALLVLVLGFLLLSFMVPQRVDTLTTDVPVSRWFVFHTLLAFCGVTALFSGGVLSILYLLADIQLKKKRPTILLRFLPSLVACEQNSRKLLTFGFPLLTLAVITGWLWSLESGRLWGPKELLAVAAWAIYAALVAVQRLRGFSGRRAAILSVTGAAAVLLAFLGIRL